MNKLIKYLITSALLVAAFSSCSSTHDELSEKAVARAKADAQLVIDAPQGSMEQYRLIFDIHDRYRRLLDTGDKQIADAYLQAADEALAQSGILSE